MCNRGREVRHKMRNGVAAERHHCGPIIRRRARDTADIRPARKYALYRKTLQLLTLQFCSQKYYLM